LHLFTPHAPNTTVSHSEGRSSTNEPYWICTRIEGIRWRTFILHTVIFEKVNAAFAETKNDGTPKAQGCEDTRENDVEKGASENGNKK